MGESAVEEIRYPREKKPVSQAIAWFVMLAFAAGIFGVGLHTVFNLHWGAGLYFILLGAFCLYFFVLAGSRLTLRAYRGQHDTWWLRASDNGFEINDRLLRPRQFLWRDIDDVAVARFSQTYDDGSTKTVEEVGLRYRPGHSAVSSGRRREKGVDIVIDGPWDRTPSEAVLLLRTWRDSCADVPRATPMNMTEVAYPRDSRRFTRTLGGLAAVVGGVCLLPVGWYLFVNRAGAGTGVVVMTVGLAAVVFGSWSIRTTAVPDFCAARSGWWIRRYDNGFEINDRLSGPRRFDWSDIEDVVVAKFQIGNNDLPTEHVGIRYRPMHPAADPLRRQKTGADFIIDGPWILRPAEAAALLNSWRDTPVPG